MHPNQSIFKHGTYHQGAWLDIGHIIGDKRTIYAGMTNHVLESDLYYLFNIINQDNIYMDSVAILGVAHVSDATYYANYVAKTLGQSLGVALVGSYTAQTLKRFLDSETSIANPRIKPEHIERFSDVLAKTAVNWDTDKLLSHHGSTRLLLSDMIANDDHQELLSPMSKEQFANVIYGDQDETQLDALFTDVVGLTRLARQLTLEMDKKATDKVKLDKITQTEKPFKRHGMTNLALHMAMSDGQTVAVLFYNPDDTPSKLQPKDILVSWKWLLNKRDVTAVLQPETGKDVNMAVLASRIMQLVDKNHARFTRNVAKQQAQDERIAELEEAISQKETTLADLDKQIADMQAKVGGVSEEVQNIPDIKNQKLPTKNKLTRNELNAVYELSIVTDTYSNDEKGGYHLRDDVVLDKYGNRRGEIDFYFDMNNDKYMVGYRYDTDYLKDQVEQIFDRSIGIDEFKKQVIKTHREFKEILNKTKIPYEVATRKELTSVTLDWSERGGSKPREFKNLASLYNHVKNLYQDESELPNYGYHKMQITLHYTEDDGSHGQISRRIDVGLKDFNPFKHSNPLDEFLKDNGFDMTNQDITPQSNPKDGSHDDDTQAHIDFLNDVIAGKYNVLADDFMEKIELAATKMYETHPDLVGRAVDYYTAKTDEYAITTA